MKRIIVIGVCGAGKSTFAKKLSKILDIQLYHLDKLWFKANWVERTKKEFDADLKQIIEEETWIIDGNYNRTIPMRIEKADTIIYLDYSTSRALKGVFKRRFQYMFKQRDDVAEGCKENINWEFLKFVLNFRKDFRPKTMKLIENLEESKRLIIFKNDKEADLFLKEKK